MVCRTCVTRSGGDVDIRIKVQMIFNDCMGVFWVIELTVITVVSRGRIEACEN